LLTNGIWIFGLNRYDFWRFFGPLPKPPEAAYVRDPDRALSALIAEYRTHPGERRTLYNMVSFAFVFCRLDSLSDVMSHDDWGEQPSGPLFRAWLRYYRALAENPESPDSASLDKAAADLDEARAFDESYFDAQAGLVRIMCLKEGLKAAKRLLKPMEISAWTRHRRAGLPAAAGARLFLADFPGLSQSEKRRHLRHARRMLLGALSLIPRSGNSDEREELTLILTELETRLGRGKAALNRLVRLSGQGSLEAQCLLSGHNMEELAEYRKHRPSDPRSFLFEGDLMMSTDPDTARMAWRSALVMDNRNVQAWLRLGDLYKEVWDRGEEAHRDTYLEAASDSYLKAVSLDPLDPGCRLRLGIVEREAGRPARALVTLQGAMALVSDDSDIRRWLALSWTDMAYSDDLSFHAQAAAAGRAREEWERLIDASDRSLFDVLGLLRSRILESAGETIAAGEPLDQIDTLLTEIIAGSTEDMSEDLLELTEDLLRQGLYDQASRLLDRIEGFIPDHPDCLTSRAVLALDENPEAAASLFLRAAEVRKPCEPAYADCLLGAADALRRTDRSEEAKSVLTKGLNTCPANRNMVRALADLHTAEGNFEEALGVYENAVYVDSGSTGLLEDGIWFSRDIGFPSYGEKWLKGELSRNPENSHLWNQLGVHYMEIGWDESSGSPEKGMLQKALDAYRRAVEIEPENAVFLGNLGDALRQAGKWIEADEVLGRALKNNDMSDEGVFALNSMARLLDERSYASEGTDAAVDDWADCGNYYHKAAVRGKGNIDYIRDYAWWLYRERRLEEAIEQYRRGAVIEPTDESIHYGESMCWRELGDIRQALSAMGRALALKPSDMHIKAEMADLLGEDGRPGDGEHLYAELLRSTGEETWVWERLASFSRQTCR
jgi:tetratricopeptide (TPR) repeat protein